MVITRVQTGEQGSRLWNLLEVESNEAFTHRETDSKGTRIMSALLQYCVPEVFGPRIQLERLHHNSDDAESTYLEHIEESGVLARYQVKLIKRPISLGDISNIAGKPIDEAISWDDVAETKLPLGLVRSILVHCELTGAVDVKRDERDRIFSYVKEGVLSRGDRASHAGALRHIADELGIDRTFYRQRVSSVIATPETSWQIATQVDDPTISRVRWAAHDLRQVIDYVAANQERYQALIQGQ